MYSKSALTLAAAFSTALATQQGFNYASTFASGGPKQQSDFQTDFQNAKSLEGTNGGFTDARLYTMIVSTANQSRHSKAKFGEQPLTIHVFYSKLPRRTMSSLLFLLLSQSQAQNFSLVCGPQVVRLVSTTSSLL